MSRPSPTERLLMLGLPQALPGVTTTCHSRQGQLQAGAAG